jgi:Flp pilus assembly pilin Flp
MILRIDLAAVRTRGAHEEEAQTMAEYAVVLGVITLAIVSAFGVLSGAIQGVIDGVTKLL